MASKRYIPFGLKDGRMVDITEVNRGLACQCVCPNCEAPLIARKGEKRVDHFAHSPGYVVCENAVETAIHRMAKEIIAELGEMNLPELVLHDTDQDHLLNLHEVSEQVTPAKRLEYSNPEIESQREAFRPDCIVYVKNKELWIEIKVTSPVNPEKKRFVREHNIPCLEIDLSKVDYQYTKESLTRYICNDVDIKRWINHPRASQIAKQLKKKLRKMINDANLNIERGRYRSLERSDTPEYKARRYVGANNPPQHNRFKSVKPGKPGEERTYLCEACRHVFKEVVREGQELFVICPKCQRSVSTKIAR